MVDDRSALTEPKQCPRCGSTRGPFEFDDETFTWLCTFCGNTWRAEFPEPER